MAEPRTASDAALLAWVTDYARAAHAAIVDDAEALAAALVQEAADPARISVERATVATYALITDDTHVLDVRWEGGRDTPYHPAGGGAYPRRPGGGPTGRAP